MTRHRHVVSARELIDVAVRFLVNSPTARRLGKVLPERLRKYARAKAAPDGRIRGLSEHVRARVLVANRKETAAWQRVRTRVDWETFRDTRLDALRRSLGEFPPAPQSLRVRITRVQPGNDISVENLVFESRPGLAVTANLYRPTDPGGSMPGILVCHSHHHPKTEDELQDMGATWARSGCAVLVMDQLCHGERRQHPFRSATDFGGRFPVTRQDYFFRYTVGMQLDLIGDSLIGWMVWDLMRGVDLLLGRPGVDPARIVLVGAVAGGGDPAAIAAALDRRIGAVIPFGFGEGRVAGPADVDYFGSGGWESTRCLRHSARDGFAPWVILGAVAGRRLIYAHEFAWDPESDPVWSRLRKIYELCGATDHLAAIHGSGSVHGHSSRDTHCNNVGRVHRRQIHGVLERWYGIPVPHDEDPVLRPAGDLLCMTPEVSAEIGARSIRQLSADRAEDLVAAARRRRSALGARAAGDALRRELEELLGDVRPRSDPRVRSRAAEGAARARRTRVVLEVEDGIQVPMMVLMPTPAPPSRPPVVIGVAQGGHRRMLHARADLLAELLRGGAAVCLPSLRGTGDAGHGDEFRGRRSVATEVSSSERMLGETLLGARLRDLRSVLRFLRAEDTLDATRVALWGDSLAPANPPTLDPAVPFDAEPYPALGEPLGGLAALLGGLFEDDVRAVYVCGGLTGFTSVLESPFCYLPHDVIVPGVLRVGDICDVAAALAPRPLRMEALVDGLNRRATFDPLEETFRPTRAAYHGARASENLSIEKERGPVGEVAGWILTRIRLP